MDPRNIFGFGIVDERSLAIDPRRESLLLRQSAIKVGTKEVVTVTIPEEVGKVASEKGLRITITCITDAIIDRSRGMDCVRSTIAITLRGQNDRNTEKGEKFWDICKQRSYQIGNLESNDWRFSITAYGKEEMKERMIGYALVVSLEDVTETVDVSSEVLADGHYPILGTVDSRVRNESTTKIGI